MTAFYMFRLMSMTFFGGYRGPAWEAAGHGSRCRPHGHATDAQVAARARRGASGRPVRARPGAEAGDTKWRTGRPSRTVHERRTDDAHGGHGHGPWHGPHESPTPMTFPLMALAVGAVLAGFVGIPAALGGGNAIEHFLEPSFTASAQVAGAGAVQPHRSGRAAEHAAASRTRRAEHETEPTRRAASSSA